MEFTEVYNEYYPRVFRLCMGYVNDEERAKDLVQEAFINVWKYLPGFRGEAALGTWVFRIATNVCLRYAETEKKHQHVAVPKQIPEAPQQNIEDKLQVLYKCIGGLKETERIIISLVLEGLPGSDIAAITGISEANVRVKIHRLKDKLSQLYKAYEQF